MFSSWAQLRNKIDIHTSGWVFKIAMAWSASLNDNGREGGGGGGGWGGGYWGAAPPKKKPLEV